VVDALPGGPGVGVGVGPARALRRPERTAVVEPEALRLGLWRPLADAGDPARGSAASTAARLPPHPDARRVLVAVVDALEVVVEVLVQIGERRAGPVHAVVAIGDGGVEGHVAVDLGDPVDRPGTDLLVLPRDHR